MLRKIRNHLDQVRSSLKMLEVEEAYDIYFSRFFGLHLARFFRWLHWTPTQVTLLSLITGVLGGLMLYFQGQFVWVVPAAVLITLAGLLDSADGQLARMTGQSTEFGRILDGAADSIVYIACYVGATAWFVFNVPFGWLLIPVALLAGYLHTLRSCVYDFYKSEMLYYGGGFADFRVETVEEVKALLPQKEGFQRTMYWLYLDYVRKQHLGSSRKKVLQQFRDWYSNPVSQTTFRMSYLKHQQALLRGWALVGGSNVHRWGIIVFSLAGRFDWFIFLGIGWTIGLVLMNHLQRKADERVAQDMLAASV